MTVLWPINPQYHVSPLHSCIFIAFLIICLIFTGTARTALVTCLAVSAIAMHLELLYLDRGAIGMSYHIQFT